MNFKYMAFLFVLLTHSFASAYYLFADKDIPVRGYSHPRSPVVSSIKAGETFEILKWNVHNTRIRLKDGTIGFIDKEYVAAYAPANNTGVPLKPISLTTTRDKNDMYKQRPGISLDYQPVSSSNAENPADDFYQDDNSAVDLDSPTDEYKEQAEYSNTELLNKLSNEAWAEAIEKRRVARFIDKNRGYRSGNRSKGMCAQAAKEALVDAGVCESYPPGDARNLHTDKTLAAHCPKLKLSKAATRGKKLGVTDISQAPAGSVIIYDGYAGKRPHNYGHIEIKVPVTPELRTKMGRDGLSVQVGQFVYCSDFCRATPTKKSTNNVIAIYTL